MTNKKFAEVNAGKECMFYFNSGVIVGWHKFYPLMVAVSVRPDCKVFPDWKASECLDVFEKTAEIPYDRIAFVNKNKIELPC